MTNKAKNKIKNMNFLSQPRTREIKLDINKTKEYHKHLHDLGYIQQRNNYNGETKWIKK